MTGTRYHWLNRCWRSLVHSRFQRLRHGALVLQDQLGQTTFGSEHDTRRVQVTVHEPQFYRRVALGGGLGAGEAFIDGEWSCDDLVGLVRLFIRNMGVADRLDRGFATVRALAARMEHAWRRNSRRGSVRNIREHYDLSNEFYGLMLDETRCYSCGLFENEQTTLSAASVAKMDRLCRQLDLQPDDHLLEIGTGWGGLAMHAARRYGCRVTTTTISAAQYEYAQARVAEAGLGDRITLLRADYRDLTGQYDKLISVEMIEAVGHEYFGTFFEKCRQLARPGALLALQAILIRDDRYEQHLQSVDFIRRHVFPGGCLPSKQVLQQISQRLGWTWQAESDITAHYVPTLQAWRRNFWNAIDTVRAMGFTERFIRLWHYYLCYCEAGFAERQTLTAQFVLSLSAGGTAGMNLGQLVSASS